MEHNRQHDLDRSSSKTTQRTFIFTGKQLLIAVLVFVALLAILWTWKSIQINSLKKEQAKREQQLKEQTKTMLVNSDQYYLKLLAKPFVWAVRSEMMSGNLSQVNLYANDMVKEKNFQSIVISDNKGIIVTSTDKKLEGKDFSTVSKQAYLTIDSTIVEQIGASKLIMTSPIMGFNSRLGTLMITYSPRKPVFK